jgi:hypothetical protein
MREFRFDLGELLEGLGIFALVLFGPFIVLWWLLGILSAIYEYLWKPLYNRYNKPDKWTGEWVIENGDRTSFKVTQVRKQIVWGKEVEPSWIRRKEMENCQYDAEVKEADCKRRRKEMRDALVRQVEQGIISPLQLESHDERRERQTVAGGTPTRHILYRPTPGHDNKPVRLRLEFPYPHL